MKYGKAIKTVRTGKGLSQLEFAKVLNKTPSYISKLEKGERVPSIELIDLISQKFKVPPYLFTLIASEKKELKGINKEDFEKLTQNLLEIIFDLDIKKSSK